MNNTFLTWLEDWYKNLQEINLQEIIKDPKKTTVVSVDVVNGFCHKGNLASPRIKEIIAPIVQLFTNSYKLGLRNFVLIQDTHDHKAVEFSTYPPHCEVGSEESDTVPEIKNLPFADLFKIIKKNSISPSYRTGFDKWLEDHKEVDTFIVVGDCTDICVYLLALHLKVYADAYNMKRRIIVPANCVDTYDLPVAEAQKIGAVPHDAEFLHRVFLYHMRLNGVEVVKQRG